MGMMLHSLADVMISVSESLGTEASNVRSWLWVSLMQPDSPQVRLRTRCGVPHGTRSCGGSRLSCRLGCQLLSGVNLVLQVERLRGD